MNRLLTLLLLLLPLSTFASLPRTFAAAQDSLDFYLSHRKEYYKNHDATIDSLKHRASLPMTYDDQYRIYQELGDNYRALNIDSAIIYYGRALTAGAATGKTGDSHRNNLLKIRLRRDALLPIRGISYEAIADFEKINPDSLRSKAERKTYFQGGVDIFSNVASLYPEGPMRKKHEEKAILMVDSLLCYHRPHGLGYRFANAHRGKLSGDRAESVAELLDTISSLEDKPDLYATASSIVADYYATQPSKSEEYLYYLMLSTISDIKAGHREVTSLQRLGQELYLRGDVERAYRYLSIALSDAIASGSSSRVLESTENLPIITKSFQQHDRNNRNILIGLVIILFVALALIIGMVLILRRDHRKLELLSSHLAQVNKNKDAYIQNILTLSSVFFERLEEFNRYVGRKIKANQIKDLADSIESHKYLSTQTEEFFKSFDQTFRNIHPTFIDDLNELLQPDKQLPALSKAEGMNPEMRIAAFMRLGIDDSAILSKFLGLSLNTIYTYRNRLKNRAKNRDTFETDIKNIGL